MKNVVVFNSLLCLECRAFWHDEPCHTGYCLERKFLFIYCWRVESFFIQDLASSMLGLFLTWFGRVQKLSWGIETRNQLWPETRMRIQIQYVITGSIAFVPHWCFTHPPPRNLQSLKRIARHINLLHSQNNRYRLHSRQIYFTKGTFKQG